MKPVKIRLAKGTSNFEFRFQYKGQRFEQSTGKAKAAEAQTLANEARRLAHLGFNPTQVRDQLAHGVGAPLIAMPARKHNGRPGVSIAMAIASYAQWREQRMREPSRNRRWREERGYFKWMLHEVIGFDALITEMDAALVRKVVTRYRDRRKNDGLMLAAGTINRSTWQLLRRVHGHARTRMELQVKSIDWTSDRDIALKEAGPVEREVRPQDQIAFETALTKTKRSRYIEGYRDVFEFGQIVGFRKQNLCIEWKQVDLGNREIKIKQKGDRKHTVQIGDALLELIRRQMPGGKRKHPTHVFSYIAQRTRKNPKTARTEIKGERYPVTPEGFATWMHRTSKAVGTRLSPHDLRRTAAGDTLRATGNIAAASKLLGHSDIGITAKLYAHIRPDDERESMDLTAAIKAKRREKYEAAVAQTG